MRVMECVRRFQQKIPHLIVDYKFCENGRQEDMEYTKHFYTKVENGRSIYTKHFYSLLV